MSMVAPRVGRWSSTSETERDFLKVKEILAPRSFLRPLDDIGLNLQRPIQRTADDSLDAEVQQSNEAIAQSDS